MYERTHDRGTKQIADMLRFVSAKTKAVCFINVRDYCNYCFRDLILLIDI